MSTIRRLWRRVLVRLGSADRRAPSPGDADQALLALADEFEINDRALHDILARDGRDTDDVPGFDTLADRQAELVGLIVATPAQGLAGLVAKARCARLRPSERGFDAAQALALSASDDLLRLVGDAPSLTRPGLLPWDPSHATTAEMPPKKKEPNMTTRPDAARRLAILRRNNGWRQLSTTLSQLGAWALGAAAVLPFYRLPLPWFVIAALGVIGVGTISLAFFVLRFIDHSE